MTTADRCPRCGSKSRARRLPAMPPTGVPWIYGPGTKLPPCTHEWHGGSR